MRDPITMAATASRSPRLLGLRFHAGANVHSTGRCVTLAIDWGDWPMRSVVPSAAWRRALATHPALPGEDATVATIAERVGRPDGAGSAIAHLAAALQRGLGHEVADPVDVVARDPVVVPIWDELAGTEAARLAFALVVRAHDPDVDARRALDGFRKAMAISHLGEDMVRLAARATRRGIPWARSIAMAPIVRLGDGVHQVHFDGGATSRTSKIADGISNRKNRAAALMRRHGLPVPDGRVVRSVDAALRAAAAIGYPVVVKPVGTNTGTAVHVDLRDAEEVRRAYATAARYGQVLVEQMIPGDHVRLLVVNGRFVSSMRLDPAVVVGDGERTVGQLIAAANVGRTPEVTSRPRIIDVDEEALAWIARHGFTLDAVPPQGQVVRLRHGSNLSRGGSSYNVRAITHPDNIRLAERAAAVLGLDIAGVDLITPDIARSYREVGGMICEINSGPSYYTREPGYENEDAVLGAFFPGGRPGRVPIVCLLGEADGAAASLVDRIATTLAPLAGKCAILAPGRIEIGGWVYPQAPERLHDAAATLLADPETGSAVMLLPRAAVEADGFAFARCDLAVVAPSEVSPAAELLRRTAEAVADPADRDALMAAVGKIVARAV